MVDEKHIEPHVPVWEKSERNDGTFSRSDFAWHEHDDEYRCPGWQATSSENIGTSPYLAPELPRPTPSSTVHRSTIAKAAQIEGAVLPEHLDAQDRAAGPRIGTRGRQANRENAALRAIPATAQEGRNAVRASSETHPAAASRIAITWSARCSAIEFLMAATVQNLRRMAMWWVPKRSGSGRSGACLTRRGRCCTPNA